MDSRERTERAINFETPDRPPFNFWMDRRRMEELDRKLGPDFRVRHYDADVVESLPAFEFPKGTLNYKEGTSWLVAPLFEDWSEVEDLPMPDPDDPDYYRPLDADLKRFRDRAVLGLLPNVLTYSELMRPQEALYMDMRMRPEAVQKLFHRMSDVLARFAEHICRRDITALYCADDIGFNHGLLLSLQDLEAFVIPHWKKVIDVAHAAGKPVFFHTDGKVDAAWELLAEQLGVRMLNPLQPNLQDVADFKRQYHGRMGIYGGLDTARIHRMSPGQIRAHVDDLYEKAGRGGGLIISSHDIDYAVTTDQLDALVDAIKQCGRAAV